MESKRLEKRIRDWANELSFKLPDGSAPPANYFAPLTATPHRRRLWETLIESVQPRSKIEQMRKQIVVARLRERKKFSGKAVVSDRIDLWHKQNALEGQVKERRSDITKLERSILAKLSDVIFEICKLRELEKLYEECSERVLALRLFAKREKDIMRRLERVLPKVRETGDGNRHSAASSKEESADLIRDELSGVSDCRSAFGHGEECGLGKKLKELSECGKSEESVWGEVVKCKERLLRKLAEFLEELNSEERNDLSEKEAEVEKGLRASVTQLKQKTTEKSLQVILNSGEGQTLDWQAERLLLSLSEGTFPRGSLNGTLGEAMSPPETGEGCLEREKAARKLRSCVDAEGARAYEAYLRGEARRLEEELERRVGRAGAWKERQKEQIDPKAFSLECVVEEINRERSEGEELAAEVSRLHSSLLRAQQSSREEGEVRSRTKAVEDADKLKCAPEQLVDVFLETPLDAFRTVESSSGRLLFECETLSHCLKGYGGELKQFFSAMLVPPRGEAEEILAEAERRAKMLTEVKELIRSREELAQQQREMQQRMGSMKLDKGVCERNFEEADGILWNALGRSEELLRGTDLIERILRNWWALGGVEVEQPYRSMVKEALVEKS